MASKKSSKKNKQQNSLSLLWNKTTREILAIILFSFSTFTLVSFFSTLQNFKPPLIVSFYILTKHIFGIGIFSIPIISFLLGGYVINSNKNILKYLCHLLAGTVVFMIGYHLLISIDTDFCKQSTLLYAGGGVLGGLPACILLQQLGKIAGLLFLLSLVLIYVSLTTNFSFIEASKKFWNISNKIFTKFISSSMPVLSFVKNLTAKVFASPAKANKQISQPSPYSQNKETNQPIYEGELIIGPREIPTNTEETETTAIANTLESDLALQTSEGTDPSAVGSRQLVETGLRPVSTWQLPNYQITKSPNHQQPSATPDGIDLSPDLPEDTGTTTKSSPALSLTQEKTEPKLPDTSDEKNIPDPASHTNQNENNINSIENILISWELPDFDEWLNSLPPKKVNTNEIGTKEKLEATLKSFSIPATVVNVVSGAAFTRFEIELEPGIKVNRVSSLEDDIALSLAAYPIRIEAPIPGKSAIGIEVPNREIAVVPVRRIFESKIFNSSKSTLIFALGEDISGAPVIADLAKMPHLLIAGATGSGKSVCLNCIISSIIARQMPDDVKFILVDMKRVELTPYDGTPHLITPVIKDAVTAANALKWAATEMDNRYKMFSEMGLRNIDAYNASNIDPMQKLHKIVIIIDELADLMMVASANLNVENLICRIAQMARAVGIHLILATQRPDVKVITGTIKANIPSRISFAVASQIDSRTILDQSGAEALLGRGDMLLMPSGSNKLIRLQGAYVSDEETTQLVNFWKQQNLVEYSLHFDNISVGDGSGGTGDIFETEDEILFKQAVEIVVTTGQVSTSMLQRKMRIGYNRSARIVDLMEQRGIIGPQNGTKPREVLLTPAGFTEGLY